MAEKENTKLFSEFAPNTTQEWMDKITTDLKGADFNRRLVWKTNEGFNVQPFYRLENMKDLKYLDAYPGDFPYVRGNKKDNNNWLVRQDILVKDIKEANIKALDIMQKGVESLGFILDEKVNYTKEDINALLAGIVLDCVEINFVCACKTGNILSIVKEIAAEQKVDLAKIQGGLDLDPLGYITLKGKFCCGTQAQVFDIVKDTVAAAQGMDSFKVVEVSGKNFNNAGSSIVEELAFSLASGVEYLSQLSERGLSIDEIAPKLRFTFATGSKYFMEVAKLRAGRYLWSKIVKAYEPKCDCSCKMNVHAETSEWNKTIYDAEVNMLRTQTEAMSAVLGGVDSFTVKPYKDVMGKTDVITERIARNQQILLKEEAHLGKVADPTGGSYYVEALTQSIIESAWKLFLEVQDKGGYVAALKEGFIQATIVKTAEVRNKAIATRKENFLGTNIFPNFTEAIAGHICSCNLEAKDMTLEGAEVETLKLYRGAQPFEALRLKTDEYSLKNERPLVQMFPIGNLNMRKARAQFACNFFACAGFAVQDHNGFTTVEEGVKVCKDNKAKIVVICSSDDEYATIAPEVFEGLSKEALIVVAGAPACAEDLKAKGITNFVNVKTNVLEDLRRYQAELGI
jgi:methylmalonyl-CoA mutase